MYHKAHLLLIFGTDRTSTLLNALAQNQIHNTFQNQHINIHKTLTSYQPVYLPELLSE